MILEVRDIFKSYGSKPVLNGIDLTLSQGDSLAIIGGSGCGKTTLAKIILGLVKADKGNVRCEQPTAVVFQDPYTSLDPMFTVRRILEESFYQQKVSKQEMGSKIKAMLHAVGLPEEVLERYPHEFSGGERQRIAIARALLSQGKIIVLDEAVSALDVLIQKQILNLLIKLKQEFNLSYIFISHNLRVVRNFSDKIAIMEQGKIVEMGTNEEIFNHPKHPFTQEILKAAR